MMVDGKFLVSAPESSNTIDLDSTEVRLLSSIGFMAARHGLADLAMRIFQGLGVVRPDAEFPCIGKVMSCIGNGDCERAIQIISDHGNPLRVHSIELRALKGLALHLMNRSAEVSEVVAMIKDDPLFSFEHSPIASKVLELLDQTISNSRRIA